MATVNKCFVLSALHVQLPGGCIYCKQKKMNYLESLRLSTLKTVSECLGTSCNYTGKVVITKRNRDLVRGDFEVRAPKLGKTWPTSTTLLVGKVRVT